MQTQFSFKCTSNHTTFYTTAMLHHCDVTALLCYTIVMLHHCDVTQLSSYTTVCLCSAVHLVPGYCTSLVVPIMFHLYIYYTHTHYHVRCLLNIIYADNILSWCLPVFKKSSIVASLNSTAFTCGCTCISEDKRFGTLPRRSHFFFTSQL